MRISTSAWFTRRRLGAAAVLVAVFASGWYLGQPVVPARCFAPPVVRYGDHLESELLKGCDEKPRVLAWFDGTFR
ncbi:hypothetical protein ACFWZ2_02465 [Streptomyces sp. NPDC059002]|uniref:hypothetical protein n=1 Tax=Streptomyces sp. NPDC059002 TaxID=3346690 RepID=UPI0036932892